MSDNGWQQPGTSGAPGAGRPGDPGTPGADRPGGPGQVPGPGPSQPPRFSVPGLGGPGTPGTGPRPAGPGGPQWGPGGPAGSGQWGPPGTHGGAQRAGQRPVIPLRPLGLGDVLGGAFVVFRRNARVLVLWGLLLSGVLGALLQVGQTLLQSGFQDRMLSAGSGSDADLVAAGAFAGVAVIGGLLGLLQFLARGFLQAPVAVDTGQRVLGRRGTFRGLWELLAGRRLAVVSWMLLQLGAGVVIGAAFVAVVFTVVAGGSTFGSSVAVLLIGIPVVFALVVWLGVKFALTVPTIALEGLGPIAAAAQSWRLTRGAWWRTFGILLLVQVMFNIAVGIAAVPLSIATSFASGIFDPLSGGSSSGAPQTNWSAGAVVGVVVGGVLIAAVTTVTDVLTASITTFLTIDRRIRTEGLDQRIAAHLDTGQPADPYAPAPTGAQPTPQRPWGQQPWPRQQPQQWQVGPQQPWQGGPQQGQPQPWQGGPQQGHPQPWQGGPQQQWQQQPQPGQRWQDDSGRTPPGAGR